MTDRITIADASRVTPAQFLEHILGPRLDAWEEMARRAERHGDHELAERLRAAGVRVAKAFARPTILELEAKQNPDGSWSVAA